MIKRSKFVQYWCALKFANLQYCTVQQYVQYGCIEYTKCKNAALISALYSKETLYSTNVYILLYSTVREVCTVHVCLY